MFSSNYSIYEPLESNIKLKIHKKYIILDIDGTLIDGDEKGIYPRPFLKDFFHYVFSNFEKVCIWTAATKEWFDLVNRNYFSKLMPPNTQFYFVWTREKCSIYKNKFLHSAFSHPVLIKELQKVWQTYPEMNASNTLILDDTESTYIKNYYNAIPITRFDRNMIYDYELQKLTKYLGKILEVNDVRFIDKKHWSLVNGQ